MNKTELVAQMADKAQVTKKDAEACLQAFMATVKDAVKAGDTVSLVGFGAFKANTRAARTGKNPRTGEAVEIKASKSPVFKAGKPFKEFINE